MQDNQYELCYYVSLSLEPCQSDLFCCCIHRVESSEVVNELVAISIYAGTNWLQILYQLQMASFAHCEPYKSISLSFLYLGFTYHNNFFFPDETRNIINLLASVSPFIYLVGS